MKRRRRTPEQIVRKLREAERFLGEGRTIPETAKTIEVLSRRPPLGQALRERGTRRSPPERTTSYSSSPARAGCSIDRVWATSLHVAMRPRRGDERGLTDR